MNENEFELILRARDEFSDEFARAQADMRAIQNAMAGLEAAGRSQGGMLNTLRAQYGALRAEWASDNVELNRLNAMLGQQSGKAIQLPLSGMEGLEQASRAVRELDEAIDQVDADELEGVQMALGQLSEVAGGPGLVAEEVKDIGDEARKAESRIRRLKNTVVNEFKKMAAATRNSRREMNNFGIKTRFTWFQLLRLGAAVGGVQLGISVMATTVIGIRNAIIGFNRDLETAILQFTTLAGSAEFAKFWLDELVDFASRTPFTFQDVVKASRQLEVFGGAALNNLENIQLIGDTAAATQTDLSNLTFWVGRFYGALKSSGALGEILTRFQELGVITPEVRTEIEDMAEEGAALQDIWDALRVNFEKFEGAMEDQSESWVGLTSTIRDNVSRLLGTAFKPFFDDFKRLFKDINDIITSPEFEESIDRFARRLRRGLDNVIAWFRENGPKIIATFVSIWQTVQGPLASIGRIVWELVKAFGSVAFWISENDRVLKILLITFVAFKIGTITIGIWGMVSAWIAAAAATGIFAASLHALKVAMITTGIGALLVGLGVLILLVSNDWRRAANIVLVASNVMIHGIEFMVNQILRGLNWLITTAADKLGDFFEMLLRIPDFLNPFDEELRKANDFLNDFAQNEAWKITLGRLNLIKAAAEDTREELEFEDPFADVIEDFERFFEGLEGNFEINAKVKSDLELALESIGKQIQDEITKAYIKGGVEQAKVVAEQQAELLEQSWETARELEALFGQDLAQALLTTFNTLKQASDDVNVSPLLIALAAIKGRTDREAIGSGATTVAATAGVGDIRFGNTYIDTLNMPVSRDRGSIEPEVISRAVSEGIKRGKFSEVGIG